MEKGRRLFLSRFVKTCSATVQDELLLLMSLCAAETSKSKDYTVKVVIRQNGEITQCTCSCVAGQGNSAACKHSGALLYCFEHYVGSKQLHQLVSKTSQMQTWHRPAPGRHAELRTAFELSCPKEFGPNGVSMKHAPSLDDVCNLAVNLKSECLLLREFREPANSTLFADHDYMKSDLSIEYINSKNHLTSQERKHLEIATRNQCKTKLWWKARITRITGSKIYPVVSTVRTGKFSEVPAKNILFSKRFKTKATEWGKKNEHLAVQVYESLTGARVVPSGLHVHPETEYIGSSPDGITTDRRNVIEVKCPYSVRDYLPTAAKCLVFKNGVYSLKRSHPYFYQVQNHMYCTGIDKCDFVIWTQKGIFVELIPFDAVFVSNMLSAVKNYYQKVFCRLAVKRILDV